MGKKQNEDKVIFYIYTACSTKKSTLRILPF